MAFDVRLNRWGLLGLVMAASLYVTMPWLSGRVGHDEQLRLVFLVLTLAAFGAAFALMTVRRPDETTSVIRSEAPATLPPPHPPWLPLFFMAQGAFVTLAVDGSLGERGSLLASFACLAGAAWYEQYGRRMSHTPVTTSQRMPPSA
jgi:hypothetical protein